MRRLFLMILAALPGSICAANAHWLDKLARGAGELGEVGAKSSRVLGALEHGAAQLKNLTPGSKGAALAAHATPEGHWQFVNRAGETFTAGTPGELKRVVEVLAPEWAANPEGKLSLFLSEETVFDQRGLLKNLPRDAELHVATNKDAYPLSHQNGDTWLARVKPNVVVPLAERRAFDEAIFQLGRPLNRANIRVVALEPGGPAGFTRVPRFDPQTKTAMIDAIEPANLGREMPSLRGQTVLVTGRVENGALRYQPASGAESSLDLAALTQAAEASDVDLVVLQSQTPRQPGGRNWLWQKIEVEGLGDAIKKASFGDFLDALGAARGELRVTAEADRPGRTLVKAEPSGEASTPVTGAVSDWLKHASGNVTGNVLTHSVTAYVNSRDRKQELDQRLVPGIPSALQYLYIGCIVMGLIGWSVAQRWWQRIWLAERREDYSQAIGYQAARTARLIAFLLLFLPVAGLPAFCVAAAIGLWEQVTAPFRLAKRYFSGKRA